MLQPGITQEITFSVSNELTAKTVGSGTLDVLATPVMIARMEQAAWMAVAPHLSPEESTVGTRMDAKHLSPTPVGMDVTCRAELTQVEGRRLVFRVTAWDAQGPHWRGHPRTGNHPSPPASWRRPRKNYRKINNPIVNPTEQGAPTTGCCGWRALFAVF